ncbi:MAG: S1 RNA-binding domain-containing protein [Synergistaceae bacterium]|jgi:S1 RNA binding domain protein|nr:S1 RNA-binding domain-containing protein [Synergistaceae bacterium]
MGEEKAANAPAVSVGDVVTGTVEHIANYGAFVRLKNGQKAMIHVSELSYNFVKNVGDVLTLSQQVTARVIKIDDRGRVDLSIKALQMKEPKPVRREEEFEKKLTFFMKQSDEKIADLNSKIKDSRGGKRHPGKK